MICNFKTTMDPVTLLKVYCIGILLFYGYFVKATNGKTYSFESVPWTEARNRCMIANETTVCDPNSQLCSAKNNIDDTSLLDNVATWVGGFYYKSLWMVNIGCYYMLDSDLARLAVKHNLPSNNNVENCAVQCGNSSFYGLVSDECYCIDGTKAFLTNVPTTFCNTPCPGNPSESCGSPRVNFKFLTVYETVQDQGLSSSLEGKNCRAINYTSTDKYEILNRDCSEQLSFSCRPNSASPRFYNYGNLTWEQAEQFCIDLDYFLSDVFYIDFSNSASLQLNTLYWIGHFRMENNYFGQDLPIYESDDPKPECLSISGTSGSYSIQKNDCTSSQSAFCLQEIQELTTKSMQTTYETSKQTNMETGTTSSSVHTTTMATTKDSSTTISETSTDATSQPSTSESLSSSTTAVTTSSTLSSSPTSIMSSTLSSSPTSIMSSTVSSESTSNMLSTPSTSQSTAAPITTTTSMTTTTSTTNTPSTTPATASSSSSAQATTTAVPPVGGGQTAQQTSSAGVYVGVPIALILAIVGIVVVGFLFMKWKKKNRRVVYRMTGPERTSNPILDLESHEERSKGMNMNQVSRRSTYRRRDPDGGEDNDHTGENGGNAPNRMTTGPLTEAGIENIVDLETGDESYLSFSNEIEQNNTDIENVESVSTSLYDRPTNNASFERQSLASSQSDVAINIEGEGDHNDIVISTENLIQSESEEEEKEEEHEEEEKEEEHVEEEKEEEHEEEEWQGEEQVKDKQEIDQTDNDEGSSVFGIVNESYTEYDD